MREERIAKLKQILEQDPNDSFSRYALALEYAGLGDKEEAVRILEEVLHRDASYVPAYQQLGYLYENIGRRTDALTILKKGITVATAHGDSHACSEMQEALDELEA